MHIYAIALGSNRRHARHGNPACVIKAAIVALGPGVLTVARTRDSVPLGPSLRHYANSACLIETAEKPEVLLGRLKRIEAAFGPRRGQRWSARVLDLDIILWSGGMWQSPALAIPHPAFRTRPFVLGPLLDIAPGWRDPLTGLRVRHLKARLDRALPRG